MVKCSRKEQSLIKNLAVTNTSTGDIAKVIHLVHFGVSVKEAAKYSLLSQQSNEAWSNFR